MFRLALLCHVCQIVAAGDDVGTNEPPSSDSWRELHQIMGRPMRCEKMVAEQCLPFLRSSAIMFHFITAVSLPKLDDIYDNFGEACVWLRYLGVESLSQVVQENWAKQMVQRWNTDIRAKACLWIYPVQSSGLILLPSDYSELINAASLFTCPNSEGDEARTPAMCLVCGKLLCSQVLFWNWFVISRWNESFNICKLISLCNNLRIIDIEKY